MKRIIYILLGLCLSLTGCLHDETTGAHLDISELSTTSEDSIFYITAAEPFVLDASKFIKQTMPDVPVEYTWSVGVIKGWNTTTKFWDIDSLSVVSNEPCLKYRFKILKKHLLRLKAVNKHMACIQYFIVDVGSSYDEGPVVFSQDEQGNGMFSYLNCPKGIDTLLTKTAADFKYVTGEDEPILNEDIVDFVFYSGNQRYPDYGNQFLYLLSKKNKTAYAIDHYSLHTIPDAVYKFSKTPLSLTLHWHDDIKNGEHDLFAFTEDGDVLSYCCKFNMEMEPTVFEDIPCWDRYSLGCSRTSGDSKQLADILWLYNDTTSTIYGMYAKDTQKSTHPVEWRRKNDYIGPYTFPNEEIINAYYGRNYQYGMQMPTYNDLFIITQEKNNPNKIWMNIWYGVSWGTNFINVSKEPSARWPLDVPSGSKVALTKDSRVLSLPERDGKYFHNDKKVFCMTGIAWPPYESKAAGREVFDVTKENPNAEITDICLFVRNEKNTPNSDKHYVFVATYDPTSAEEKKGSIYVLAADDLSNVVAKYENVAYKPLNVFYKNRL